MEDILLKTMASSLRGRFAGELGRSVKTEGEVCPTDVVPVIASNKQGERSAFPMKWGFTLPDGKKPVVNARVETAAQKPMFREAWQRRRCIVPASWYFEWDHIRTSDGKTKTGEKYRIHPDQSNITWLCGLYSFEKGLPVFTIITRSPGEAVSKIHDRMPLILPKDKIDDWIRPGSDPEALLPYTITDMILEKESPDLPLFSGH